MAEAGRPTELTEELTLQIRKKALAGEKYIQIQDELGILPSTWDSWVYRNTQGFRDDLVKWKAERLTKKAEDISEFIMSAPRTNANGDIINFDVLKLQQKEAKFIRETLGKDAGYTTRAELAGPNGTSLIPPEKAAKANAAVKEFLKNKDGKNIGDTERERQGDEKKSVPVQPEEQQAGDSAEIQPLG